MARKLATFSPSEGIAHWTFTYWKNWPRTAGGLQEEKTRLNDRLTQLGVYGFWHLEFQQRGAPHWHCLVAGDDLERKENLARDWWKKRTFNPHDECMKATPGELGKAAWYFALHAQKEDQTPDCEVGRWWGVINGPRVKAATFIEQIAENVRDRETIWLKRMFRRMTGARGSLGTQGFSWFLPKILHVRVLVRADDLARRSRLDRMTPHPPPGPWSLEKLSRYYARL